MAGEVEILSAALGHHRRGEHTRHVFVFQTGRHLQIEVGVAVVGHTLHLHGIRVGLGIGGVERVLLPHFKTVDHLVETAIPVGIFATELVRVCGSRPACV